MKLLLDTHTWIWWNLSPQKLSEKALKTIQSHPDEILLSSISLWEFSKLAQKKRIYISIDALSWIKEALKKLPLRVIDLTPEIIVTSTTLPQPFHDDPADQLIVATARSENAILITADQEILHYPHAKTLW